MRLQLLVILICSFFALPSIGQLKSPEEYLGYAIGSQFTPYYKIEGYFKHAAENGGGLIRLQQYGQTIEGRPLFVAFLSSTTNINRLENIRENNLALARLLPNSAKGEIKNTPVLVWLSYNVHGDEPSSSEAAMLTVYELLKNNNGRYSEWLNKSVVIIDPCLNPDGRERYVNWFQSVAGKNYNVNIDAREHNPAWPGGRTNHYYFDLNRDWAWQTQKESVQRLKLYNDWLPQIHVDFHEQEIDDPYYFAPAAQPYHEVITPWQRQFQYVIGQNHAKYFDEKGWLYFTKEVYDLLYPSYGDTYPLYNGAIGMTYEQGGGALGGVAVETSIGDTLTLYDRAIHHFTTAISTIEVATKNSEKLLTAFNDYYDKAVTEGVGEYQSYIIKNNPADNERVAALLNLLQKNNIQFGAGKKASVKGYSYFEGKEVSFTVDENDIVIPGRQPKGALVKVLFEPKAALVDSLTYDITAWSLPYAYGLNTFALKQPLAYTEKKEVDKIINKDEAAYGYIVRWNGVKSVKFISRLLQKGIRLRFTEEPFESGGQRFERGSIIILKTSNQGINDLWSSIRFSANLYNMQLYPVKSGFVDKGYDFGSARVRSLKDRNVALLTGEHTAENAVGEVWHFFEQEIEHPITLINTRDFKSTSWKDFDVLILADGDYDLLSDRLAAASLKSWIEGGGQLIAMQGAVAQLSKLEWTLKNKKKEEPIEDPAPYEAIKAYENRERDNLPNVTPGSIYKLELDNTHPLAFGYPSFYYTLKQDSNIYEFVKEGGWNVGVLKKAKPVAGFVGSKLVNDLQDGLLFGTQNIGRGGITYLADDVLFRSFWEGGKLMFCNAVFLVGQ